MGKHEKTLGKHGKTWKNMGKHGKHRKTNLVSPGMNLLSKKANTSSRALIRAVAVSVAVAIAVAVASNRGVRIFTFSELNLVI